MSTDKQVARLLDEIRAKLDSMEELAMWTIKADQRFKKGQRVQFSPLAMRRGMKAKGGVIKGTVVGVDDSFSVKVLMDGYKRPHEYHHGFFEPVGNQKK